MGNVLAIFVAAIVSYALGALWYSPVLFGNPWMRLMKLSKKDLRKAQNKAMRGYLITFITTLVTAIVLSLMITAVGASISTGLKVAFLAWLGFIATSTLGSTLWEDKPVELWLLNNAYYLLSFILMGAILGTWI